MSKIKFVFLSKDDKFMMTEKNFEQCSKTDIDVEYINNNSESIAKVYNSVLNRIGNEYDYVVLSHADVVFSAPGLISQLEETAGKYDVMGLCGCTNISVGESPLNWYCGSRNYPSCRFGKVAHGELNMSVTFFNSTYPDIKDIEVACIDGLCIIFSRKAIESGLRFDESISGFSCYDTDISFQTVMKYHLKLGVLVRHELIHQSVGKSISSKEFAECEKRLREKWGFETKK